MEEEEQVEVVVVVEEEEEAGLTRRRGSDMALADPQMAFFEAWQECARATGSMRPAVHVGMGLSPEATAHLRCEEPLRDVREPRRLRSAHC